MTTDIETIIFFMPITFANPDWGLGTGGYKPFLAFSQSVSSARPPLDSKAAEDRKRRRPGMPGERNN
jgi:hypothetical protein